MSELENRLNSILNDPQTMSQIMAFANSLGGGPQSPPAPSNEDAPGPETPEAKASELSALSSLFAGEDEDGGLDPRLLTLASRAIEAYQTDDGRKAALLQALRPYVQEKRYARLDKALQIAKLSRLIRVALDVFKGGETDHV